MTRRGGEPQPVFRMAKHVEQKNDRCGRPDREDPFALHFLLLDSFEVDRG